LETSAPIVIDHTMTTKVVLRLLVFALAFTMHTTHPACGEVDCYQQKEKVKSKCMKALNIITDYVKPSEIYCKTVRASDMTCVCHALEPEEVLQKVSAVKLVRLSRECGNLVAVGSKCGCKYQFFTINYLFNLFRYLKFYMFLYIFVHSY